MQFRDLLQKKVLILDGPTGTELERQGVNIFGKSWTAGANTTHPDVIRSIHEEYIQAGADIITANTFRTNARALKDLPNVSPKELTLQAVKIAKEAVSNTDKQVFIAGSIAPVEDCFSPDQVPSSEVLLIEHTQMANWLVEAGADLILIETMNTLREALIALNAVKQVTTLPVLVSLVPLDGEKILSGESIFGAIEQLAEYSPDAMLFNCAPLSVMKPAMFLLAKVAQEYNNIPFGAYPNASERCSNGNWDLTATSDQSIAEAAKVWIAQGASIIGSCCGTTPMTTKLLASLVHN